MFSNIGKKIKVLAIVMFALEALASFVGGLAMIAEGNDELIIIGVITVFAGILVSWIMSWFVYGFGEIIDKLTDIEFNTRAANRNDAPNYMPGQNPYNMANQSTNGTNTDNAGQTNYVCASCGFNGNYGIFCPNCGSSEKKYI